MKRLNLQNEHEAAVKAERRSIGRARLNWALLIVVIGLLWRMTGTDGLLYLAGLFFLLLLTEGR